MHSHDILHRFFKTNCNFQFFQECQVICQTLFLTNSQKLNFHIFIPGHVIPGNNLCLPRFKSVCCYVKPTLRRVLQFKTKEIIVFAQVLSVFGDPCLSY